MKNIGFYNKDCINFQLEVIKRKQESDFKTQLIQGFQEVIDHSNHYSDLFNRNQLNQILRNNTTFHDYSTLYNYSSKSFIELKNELTTGSEKRLILCQYCTLNEVSSFDHISPKSEYGAYSIHPLNLFPCCSECNSYKGSRYLEGEDCRYLNLYKDILPIQQYLFVEINIGNQTKSLEIEYSVRNDYNIDDNLFRKLRNHYEDFQLLRRFKENSYQEYNILKDSIGTSLTNVSLDMIKTLIRNNINAEKSNYGSNYWKAILKETLINEEDFLIDFM